MDEIIPRLPIHVEANMKQNKFLNLEFQKWLEKLIDIKNILVAIMENSKKEF